MATACVEDMPTIQPEFAACGQRAARAPRSDDAAGMDTLGTRLGVLCLTAVVLLGGCADPSVDEADLRTPPARDNPSLQWGDLADHGADGVGGDY